MDRRERELESISISQAFEIQDDVLHADVGSGEEPQESHQEQADVLDNSHPGNKLTLFTNICKMRTIMSTKIQT
jgi:hypothetical protein